MVEPWKVWWKKSSSIVALFPEIGSSGGQGGEEGICHAYFYWEGY